MFLYSELFTSATHNSLAQRLVLEERTLRRGGSLMSLVADTGRMYLCFVCTICFSLYRLLFPFVFRSLPGILPLHKSKGSWCLKD